MQRPTAALLQICEAEDQIPTATIRDLQTNREAWRESFTVCAARMCRLVQWFEPKTDCDALPPANP